MSMKIITIMICLICYSNFCCGEALQNISGATEPAITTLKKQNILDKMAQTLRVKHTIIANKERDCKITTKIKNKNQNNDSVVFKKGACYVSRISLTSKIDFLYDNWSIYFSQVDPVVASIPGELMIEHINGDLHRIGPGKYYKGLASGNVINIDFISKNYHISDAEFMPNMYIVVKSLDSRTIASTKILIDSETNLEILKFATPLHNYKSTFFRGSQDKTIRATPEYLYQKYATNRTINSKNGSGIIPRPKSIITTNNDLYLDLHIGVNIRQSDFPMKQLNAAFDRLRFLGLSFNKNGIPIDIIKTNGKKSLGSYTLDITSSKITIASDNATGAFYALQSLAGLKSLNSTIIPLIKIEDSPRYQFRGMHIDLARNFLGKAFILDLLDQMAAYKLNKLHLHLGDDEGWRLQIKDLPELTLVGSKRCHNLSEDTCLIPQLGSGPKSTNEEPQFFSIKEYKEILNAATARHINIIPSFDMPGHSRAAIKSMEVRYRHFMALNQPKLAKEFLLTDYEDLTSYESIQFYNDNTLNVCMASTYRFIEKIIKELKKVHTKVNHPLTVYHLGGDETAGAWTKSPQCKKFLSNNSVGVTQADQLTGYFIQRVSNFLLKQDIQPAGWSDGMNKAHDKLPQDVQSNTWDVLSWEGHLVAHKQINQGWDVVLSTPDALYFDFPYEAIPEEGGYSWASRHISSKKVFQFMPDNLPIHAEIWVGSDGRHYSIDDRLQRDELGHITHSPLKKGSIAAGIQGQLWSETVRTKEQAEYQIYPRLLALAERAWHKADWEVAYNNQGALYNRTSDFFSATAKIDQEVDWNRFVNILGQKELPKLEKSIINYRLPLVGARIEKQKLMMNLAIPALTIEYQQQGKPWKPYIKPVKVLPDLKIKIRSVSRNGKRKGLTTTLN